MGAGVSWGRWPRGSARRAGRLGHALVVALVALASSSPQAQTSWDPERYLDLATEGQERYQNALGYPVGSEERRNELFEAGRHLKEALGMVRVALASDEYAEDVAAALGDYFTLTENVIVIWLALDACEPGQGLLDEVRANPQLTPEAAALFENLEPRLNACRERVGTWAWSRYQGLVARADMRREQAVAGTQVDPALLAQAADASAAALAAYRDSLHDGELGPVPVTDPVAELVARYDQTLSLQIDAAQCEEAAATEALSEVDRAGLMQWTSGRLARSAEVASCVQGEIVVTAERDTRDGAGGPAPSVRETGAWALVGAGVVLALSGLAIELGTLDERDALVALEADCGEGAPSFCDDEARSALEDDLDSRELARSVVLGVGGAAILAGVVLLVTAEPEAEAPSEGVSIAPTFGVREVGVSLGVAF